MNNREDQTAELAWTGERYLPFVRGDIELEHLHRYAFARDFVKGKDVLDIACGEGYGSFLLADGAKSVIGVDLSNEVVRHARKKYAAPNLKFEQGNCTSIPIKDCSIDIVVSFETIEHHNHHDAMLAEIKRVLRPDGILVISTPERNKMSKISQQRNEFHVKELSHSEFAGLLSHYFKHCTFFGQRIRYGSLMTQIDTDKIAGTFSFYSGDCKLITRNFFAPEPLFLIAIASEYSPPVLERSFFDGSDFLRSQLAKADSDRYALVAEIARIKATASWRITKPLRFFDFIKRHTINKLIKIIE